MRLLEFNEKFDSRQIIYDNALVEQDFGRWEGLSFEDVKRQFPQQLADWQVGNCEAPTEGESLSAVSSRVKHFLDHSLTPRIIKRDSPIYLVGHAAWFQCFCHLTVDFPLKNQWSFRVDPSSISEFLYLGDRWILNRLSFRDNILF